MFTLATMLMWVNVGWGVIEWLTSYHQIVEVGFLVHDPVEDEQSRVATRTEIYLKHRR